MRLTRIMKAGMVAAMAAVMVFSLGATAWGTTGLDGPTPPKTGDPVTTTTQNEKQLLSLGNVTGGNFTLSYFLSSAVTCRTANIAWNASAAAVQSAMETPTGAGCSAYFTGNVTVTGASPTYTLEFVGTLANTNINQWSAASATSPSGSGLTALAGTSARIYVSTIQNGRFTGTGISAPAVDSVDPHGGYSSATNYCLQCHAVHSYEFPTGTINAPGDYALLIGDSVTDTCNTCHKLFGGTGGTTPVNSNAIVGGGAAFSIGTASVRSAYDVTSGGSDHTLGTDNTPAPDSVAIQELGWGYGSFTPLTWYLNNEPAAAGTSHVAGAAGDPGNDGGLYCGSCHTPHGEFGQVVNAARYRSNAGADNLDAVQYVFIEGLASGDTWTLTYGTETTAALAWDATTAAVATALENLTALTDVTVAGTPLSATNLTGNYAVTFENSAQNSPDGNKEHPQMAVTVPAGDTGWVITGQGGSTAVTEETPNTTDGNAANGTLVAVRTFGDDKPIFQYNKFNRPQVFYLNAPNDTTTGGGLAVAWERCTSVDGSATTPSAGAPTGCELLTIADAEGQIVYEYGYKLLTAYPNHNWLKAESWGLGYRATDSARWCGACHTTKTGGEFGVEGEYAVAGVTYHSHPTACSYCHGNPTDGSSFDFPHTSTKGKLLKEFPDALCISCHRSGTLP